MEPTARVVDEHVDPAEVLAHLGEERLDRVGVADVEDRGDDLPVQRGDRVRRLRQTTGLPVADRDVGSEAHQRERGRLADSLGRPGDERHLPRQRHRRRVEHVHPGSLYHRGSLRSRSSWLRPAELRSVRTI